MQSLRIGLVAFLWIDAFLLSNLLLISLRHDTLPKVWPDTYSYFWPFEYLIKQGRYWEDYRMPGYGLPYGLFFLLTRDSDLSYAYMAIFNLTLILSAILVSVNYVLRFTGNKLYAHLTGGIWVISVISHWWFWLLPDPTVAAVNVLTAIALAERNYLGSGIGLAYMTFARPLSGILLPIGALCVIWIHRYQKSIFRKVLYFILPFLVLDSLWIVRSYITYRDFRPLHGTGTTYGYSVLENKNVFYIKRRLGENLSLNDCLSLWNGDYKPYFNLIPDQYLSPTQKDSLSILLKLLTSTPATADPCALQDSSEHIAWKLSHSLKVPSYTALAYRFYHTFFGGIICISQSLNPLRWIPHVASHAIYIWGGASFIVAILTANAFFLYALLTQRLNYTSIIFYFFSVSVPVAHLFMHMERRYFYIYFPSLMISTLLTLYTILRKPRG